MNAKQPPMPGAGASETQERRRVGFRLREDLAQRLDRYQAQHSAAQVDVLNAAVEYWLDAVDEFERTTSKD